MSMKPFPREHGTDRGYQQHRSHNDTPACAPCREAHRIVTLANDRRRRLEVRCVECGEPAGRGRRTYCGDACYAAGKNRRERERAKRVRSGELPAPAPAEVKEVPRIRWIKRGLILVAVEDRIAS